MTASFSSQKGNINISFYPPDNFFF